MELTTNIKDFVTSGNSTFTVLNDETDVRYTFKVKKVKDRSMFFVSYLYGTDNESDYKYIGVIDGSNTFRLTKGSKVAIGSIVFRAFSWLWMMVSTNKEFPSNFHFYHEGRCAKCGRKLTTPESIESGFGPICRSKGGM